MSVSVDVLICCHNQKEYIAQCLTSVLAQKKKVNDTDFSFRVIISDDASNDGSQDVIRQFVKRYPHKITPYFQKKNLGRFKNKKFLMRQAHGTYVATCDGDDFWLDDYKLQKQIDFLESHPEFSICYTRCLLRDEKNNDSRLFPTKQNMRLHATHDKTNFTRPWIGYPYSSMVFRRHSFNDFPYEQFDYFDHVAMIYQSLRHGKGAVLDFVGSYYRLHQHNDYAGRSTWERWRENQHIYEELYRCYPDDRIPRLEYETFTFKLAQYAYETGQEKLAQKYLRQFNELLATSQCSIDYKLGDTTDKPTLYQQFIIAMWQLAAQTDSTDDKQAVEHYLQQIVKFSTIQPVAAAKIICNLKSDKSLSTKFVNLTFNLARFAYQSSDKQLASDYLAFLAHLSPAFFLQVPHKIYLLAPRLQKIRRHPVNN